MRVAAFLRQTSVIPVYSRCALVSVVRFRPRPPRFTLQRSQPMRLASLFPGTNSPRVRSISGLLLFLENFPHFSPCQCFFQVGRVRQSMFRTDTAGTPALNKGVRRASVSAVPEETISELTRCRAELSGIIRYVNGASAAVAVSRLRRTTDCHLLEVGYCVSCRSGGRQWHR